MKTSVLLARVPLARVTLARVLAIGLILPAVLAGPSPGTLPEANAQTAGSGRTGGSVAFLEATANAGRFEVRSGRLALERSEHAGVRAYADRTVKDADAMVSRVKSINIADAGAAMPPGLNATQTVLLSRLALLRGAEFNREYMRAQIEVSELLRQTFSDYGANGPSPAMRDYAAQAVTDYDAQILQARAVAGSL